MHNGGVDTHDLAVATKETADTSKADAEVERQLTVGQNAAVLFANIDYDANGFVTISLNNRGKVLATNAQVDGTIVRVDLPSLKKTGITQPFSFVFPVIRVDDAANKSQPVHAYGREDFQAFTGGTLGTGLTSSGITTTASERE